MPLILNSLAVRGSPKIDLTTDPPCTPVAPNTTTIFWDDMVTGWQITMRKRQCLKISNLKVQVEEDDISNQWYRKASFSTSLLDTYNFPWLKKAEQVSGRLVVLFGEFGVERENGKAQGWARAGSYRVRIVPS